MAIPAWDTGGLASRCGGASKPEALPRVKAGVPAWGKGWLRHGGSAALLLDGCGRASPPGVCLAPHKKARTPQMDAERINAQRLLHKDLTLRLDDLRRHL